MSKTLGLRDDQRKWTNYLEYDINRKVMDTEISDRVLRSKIYD